MENSKHAYLILAHSDPKHLQDLVNTIDDPRNDIYIHIDGKSDIIEFQNITASKSSLAFIKNRISVYWGDTSIIEAEYALFECVRNKHYNRIHLISGADFLLKSQDYIHNFFDSYVNDEFIDFEDETQIKGELTKKIRMYNFFLPYISHRNKMIAFVSNLCRRCLLVLQMILGIRRHYKYTIKKGSEWASMTQKFINELLNHKADVLCDFRFTHCTDEIYKQTIAWNSDFKNHISPLGNLRFIDFKRGNRKSPYTFTEEDYNLLINSEALFARKFSSSTSSRLIELLKTQINKTQ